MLSKVGTIVTVFMIKKVFIYIFILSCFLQIVHAEDSNFYLGLGYGNAQYKGKTLNNIELKNGSKLSKSSEMYQLYVGYKLIKELLDIEVSCINLGNVKETFSLNPDLVFFDSPNDTLTLNGKGFTISPALKWNLSEMFSLSGSLGISVLDVKQDFSGGFSETSGSLTEVYSRAETKLFGGIGAEGRLIECLALHIQWQRFQVLDTNIDTLSGKLKLYF